MDDEARVRNVALAMLQTLGLTVLVASNGSEAIEHVRASHHRIGMVLLDVTMPGLSLKDALKGIHAIDASIPVVLMSGYNEPQATESIERSMVAGFVKKPFDVDSLITEISAALKLNLGKDTPATEQPVSY